MRYLGIILYALFCPYQDLPDEDEMTTEKLMMLEKEKKRKKEEQLKALIDREAAITEVTVSESQDSKEEIETQLFSSLTRRTRKIQSLSPAVRTSSTLTTLTLISTCRRWRTTQYRPASL